MPKMQGTFFSQCISKSEQTKTKTKDINHKQMLLDENGSTQKCHTQSKALWQLFTLNNIIRRMVAFKLPSRNRSVQIRRDGTCFTFADAVVTAGTAIDYIAASTRLRPSSILPCFAFVSVVDIPASINVFSSDLEQDGGGGFCLSLSGIIEETGLSLLLQYVPQLFKGEYSSGLSKRNRSAQTLTALHAAVIMSICGKFRHADKFTPLENISDTKSCDICDSLKHRTMLNVSSLIPSIMQRVSK